LIHSMVNERWGFIRTGANTIERPNALDIGAEVRKTLQSTGTGLYEFNHRRSGLATYGNADGILYASHEVSPRWVYADTLSWLQAHPSSLAENIGFPARNPRTRECSDGPNTPRATMGNTTLAPVTGIGRSVWQGRLHKEANSLPKTC
jgi:hypothetical protein